LNSDALAQEGRGGERGGERPRESRVQAQAQAQAQTAVLAESSTSTGEE
jgi:hypothetical protein